MTQRDLDIVTTVSLSEVGVLPDSGGWNDQPYTWVRVWPLVMQQIRVWQAAHHERAMRKAKAKR